MGLPNWGTVAGYVFGWVDRFIPSKKAMMVDTLKRLENEYADALRKKKDTKAAEIRKQMIDIRRKLGWTDGEI